MKSNFRDLEAFFFDFDGVLADSVEVKTLAFAKLFESYGPEIEARVVDHHRKNGGMTRKDKFKYYYREFLKKPLDDAEMKRLCVEFSSLVVDGVISAPEIPGVGQFIDKWYKMVACFVVSATPDDEIGLIVKRRGLEKYFRCVLGSSRSKKENLEILITKYHLDTARCVFFGDAESDYNAAMACGINFIGIIPGRDAQLLKTAPDIRWSRDFVELVI